MNKNDSLSLTTPPWFEETFTRYRRIETKAVRVGKLVIGAGHPIWIQSMVTTDTMDTAATVEQIKRLADVGCDIVRVTVPNLNAARNLEVIKSHLIKAGYDTPLVADVHFTPQSALIAAEIVEKVRINPGNFVDRKHFEEKEYSEEQYHRELERVEEKLLPLVEICKKRGTALRIGSNHGSLSDRIFNRYGDGPEGMVSSALEFLDICEKANFDQVVFSMKSSNTLVMVAAYRLLVHRFWERGNFYPIHLGVTEAGDDEDGRAKSALGIGTLLLDGIGDTVRVSLTEDPEREVPVARKIVAGVEFLTGEETPATATVTAADEAVLKSPLTPFAFNRMVGEAVDTWGGQHPIQVMFSPGFPLSDESHLRKIGIHRIAVTDKWHSTHAPDLLYFPGAKEEFPLYPTCWEAGQKVILSAEKNRDGNLLYEGLEDFMKFTSKGGGPSPGASLKAVRIRPEQVFSLKEYLRDHPRFFSDTLLLLEGGSLRALRRSALSLKSQASENSVKSPPVVLSLRDLVYPPDYDPEARKVVQAIYAGYLLADGLLDGVFLENGSEADLKYLFSVLQASRQRISKPEYISCPSCGRTLFDLQTVTARVKAATQHLVGVKIAVMGCIVNGPGEMADADFGYVGSGPGKITLYRGKEVMVRNVDSDKAVQELVALIKREGFWKDPELVGQRQE